MRWDDRAVCKGFTHLFFLEVGRRPTEARDMCDRCPVRAECLESALIEERGQSKARRFGFRAGLTPRQRIVEDARRRREAA